MAGDFAFDNETPGHSQYVDAFALADRPVTNREYLAFIEDGGYDRPELWLSDGWFACTPERLDCAPVLGACGRPLASLHPGRDARTGSRRARLPRQLLRGRRLRPLGRRPACHRGRVGDRGRRRGRGHRGEFPRVGAIPPGAAVERVDVAPAPHDRARLFGDVWEWTQSPYTPYRGYRPAAGALGEYNGKFMCNQMVLRGGSCATPGSAHPGNLPELLSARVALAVLGHPPGPRRLNDPTNCSRSSQQCAHSREQRIPGISSIYCLDPSRRGQLVDLARDRVIGPE